MATTTSSPSPAGSLATIRGEHPFPPLLYSRPVFEDIRRVAVDQFLSIPRGGLEIGGVLFGNADDSGIRITAHRPLPLEYMNGPSFVLSDVDKDALRGLLDTDSDPELAGLETVGWYHTHTRSSTALTPEDLDIHREFFGGPRHVAVVIKPHKFDPADVVVYAPCLAESEPVAAFRLEPCQTEAPAPAPEPRPAAAPAPRDTPRPDQEPPTFHAQPARRTRLRVLAATAGALACLAAAAAFITREHQPAAAPAPVEQPQLHLSDSNRNLQIAWSSPTADVRSAELMIIDGPDATTLPVQFDELRRGSLTYVRNSSRVEVRLRIHSRNGVLNEQVARFLGPAPAPAATTPAVTVPAPAASTAPEPRLPEPVPQPVETRIVRVPPPIARTIASPVLDANAPAVASATPQAATPIAPASLPPPPPQARPARSASGRAIWTGRLERDGILLIDGTRPSTGVLTGSMPSGPARIRVYPGDLTANGIVVYSDRDRIEPPSAANGWNLTAHRIDQRRGRDVTVLEAPGADNGWKRLMIRGGNRPLPIIVIEWSE